MTTVITYKWAKWPEPGLFVPNGVPIPAFNCPGAALLIDELEVEIYPWLNRGIMRISFTPAGRVFDRTEAAHFLLALITALNPQQCSTGYSDYALNIVAHPGEDIEKVMADKYQVLLRHCGIRLDDFMPDIERQDFPGGHESMLLDNRLTMMLHEPMMGNSDDPPFRIPIVQQPA